jgi:hypothetical protein
VQLTWKVVTPVERCAEALHDLGSAYGAFNRIGAEIANASVKMQTSMECFGQELGYALSILGECFDLKGQAHRRAGEELARGIDIYLVKLARLDGVFTKCPKSAWPVLRKTEAFAKIVDEINSHINAAEDILLRQECDCLRLRAILNEVQQQVRLLEMMQLAKKGKQRVHQLAKFPSAKRRRIR